MEKDLDIKKLWNYYKEKARINGADPENITLQTPFSVLWYYDGFDEDNLPAQLNPLTKAFLGDGNAKTELKSADDSEVSRLKDMVKEYLKNEKRLPNVSIPFE